MCLCALMPTMHESVTHSSHLRQSLHACFTEGSVPVLILHTKNSQHARKGTSLDVMINLRGLMMISGFCLCKGIIFLTSSYLWIICVTLKIFKLLCKLPEWNYQSSRQILMRERLQVIDLFKGSEKRRWSCLNCISSKHAVCDLI